MLTIRTTGILGLLVFPWIVALYTTSSAFLDSFLLVINQSFLLVIIFYLIKKTAPSHQSVYGPRLIFIFGLHVFLYYSISNIIPALLPELRPQIFLVNLPVSSVWSYTLATIAALLMLLGIGAGSSLVLMHLPVHFSNPKSNAWLPGYKLSFFSCLAVSVTVMVGTTLFGVETAVGAITNEELTNMTLIQKLLFHGLLHVLAMAPILAAAALVKARNFKQQRLSKLLLFFACLLTLGVMLIWGQRSTAMLALALPLALLTNVRIISWRKAIFPTIGLMFIIYSCITIVRDSDLLPLLSRTPDLSQLTISDVASALTSKDGNDHSVATRGVMDLSYRTAGLEAVAALIQEQYEGRLHLQWGNTIYCGFLQALPLTLRPEADITARIKTAPAYLGVFQPVDWVTTVLAEFVLDFGPFLLFFPAVFAGVALTLIDQILFRLGQKPALEGLLILRIVFFLFIISSGDSLADMTVMLFKATIGYTVIFIILSYTIHCFRQKRIIHHKLSNIYDSAS